MISGDDESHSVPTFLSRLAIKIQLTITDGVVSNKLNLVAVDASCIGNLYSIKCGLILLFITPLLHHLRVQIRRDSDITGGL